MILWSFCFFSSFLAFFFLVPDLCHRFLKSGPRDAIVQLASLLHTIQESIEAGLVQDEKVISTAIDLAPPWGQSMGSSLKMLRAGGSPIIPALKRMRRILEAQLRFLDLGKSRSSQSLVQAGICVALSPLLGTLLYFMIPGLSQFAMLWFGLNVLGFIFCLLGGLWIIKMADLASWGGVREELRGVLTSFPCFCDQIISQISVGTPPDIAWSRSARTLGEVDWRFYRFVGSSVWVSQEEKLGRIVKSLEALRKTLQVSLLEGRPSLERIESILEQFEKELTARVEYETSLLPTRTLKPLYLLIAPTLFGLLGMSLFLGLQSEITL